MVCSIQGLPTFMLKCHGCKLSFTLANCGHLIYNQLQQINLYMLCCVVFHSVLCEKRWKNIHSFLHQQSCIVSYKLFIYSTQIHWLSTCNCSLSIHRHLSVSFSLFVFVFSLTLLFGGFHLRTIHDYSVVITFLLCRLESNFPCLQMIFRLHKTRVGFLPGRKVFLLCCGEEKGKNTRFIMKYLVICLY